MALRVAELEAVISADSSQFDSAMGKADSSIAKLAGGAALMGAGKAIMGGLGDVIGIAADVEQQVDAVQAAFGGLNDTDLGRVNDQMMDIGASSSFTTQEVGGLIEQMAKSGVGIEDVLGGATQAAVDMASATGENLISSGAYMSQTANMFGLAGDDMTKVADITTNALNESSMSMADLQRGVGYLGPVFSQLAQYADDPVQALNDTNASIAYFNSLGLKGGDAGVSIARGLTQLADPSSEATYWMNELGISAYDAQGNMLPFPDILDQLQVGLAGASDLTKQQALSSIFGAEALDVMTLAVDKGGDGWRDYQQRMEKSGSAQEQANIRMDNFAGSIEKMNGAIDAAKGALGKGFLDPLRGVVDAIADIATAFSQLPPEVLGVIGAFAAAAAGVAVLTGAFTLLPVVMGPIAAGFAAMMAAASALAPVLAVIGLGVLAYKTNFLGFGDAVDTALTGIQNFATNFKSSLDTALAAGVNPFVAGIQALADALFGISGDATPDWIVGIGKALQTAGKAVDSFIKRWDELTGVMTDTGEAVEDIAGGEFWKDFFGAGAEASDDTTQRILDNAAAIGIGLGGRNLGHMVMDENGVVTWFEDAEDAAGKGSRVIIEEAGTIRSGLEVALRAAGDVINEFFPESGWGDRFLTAADAVGAFTDAHRDAINQGLNPFHAAALGVLDAIDVLAGGTAGWTDTVRGAITDVQQFTSSLGLFRAQAEAAGDSGLAAGIRGIGQALEFATGIDITGFTDGLADAVNAVGDFASSLGTMTSAILAGDWDTVGTMLNDALGDIDLGEVVVNIGSWALGRIADFAGFLSDVITGEGSGLGHDLHGVLVNIISWAQGKIADLAGFLQDAVTGEGSGAGHDLHGVLVNIASWALGSVASIGDFLNGLFGGGAGPSNGDPNGIGTNREGAGAAGAGANLNGVLVNILSWAAGEIADLGAWIADTAIPAMGQLMADIAAVAVNIGTWALGKVADLAGWITGTAIPSMGQLFAEIPAVAVNIATWAKGKMEDLGAWITSTAIPAMGQIAAEVPSVLVSIGEWALDPDGLNLSGLWDAIKGAWNAPDANMAAEAAAVGEEIGSEIGQMLGDGINAALDAVLGAGSASGGPSTSGEQLSAWGNADDGINWGDVFGGMIDGMVAGASEAIGPAFDRLQDEIGPLFETAVSGVWDWIQADLGKMSAPKGPSPLYTFMQDTVLPWLIGGTQNIGAADGMPMGGEFVSEGVTDKIVQGVQDELDAMIDGVVSGIGDAFSGLGGKLQEASSGIQAGIQEASQGFYTMISDAFESAFSGGGGATDYDAMGGFGGGGGAAPIQFDSIITDMVVTPMLEAVQQIPAKLAEAGGAIKEGIAAAASDFFTMIGDAFNAAFSGGGGATDYDAMGGFGGGGESGFVAQIAADFVAGLSTAPQEIAEAIKASDMDWSAIPNAMKEAVSEGMKQERSLGDELMDQSKGAVDTSSWPTPTADFMSDIVDWLLPTAGAAEMSPEVEKKITDFGTDFGEQLAQTMTGQEFQTAIDTALSSEAGAAAFDGLGQTFNDMFQAAIIKDLGTTDAAGGDAVASDVAKSIATSLATGIAAGITESDVAEFAPVGQAMVTKLNDAVALAMQDPKTFQYEGEAPTAVPGTGGGMGAALVTSLAASMAASVTSADPAAFAPVGMAIQSKLNEAIAASMGQAQQLDSGSASADPRFGGDSGSTLGAGMVQGLATGMAASVTAADPSLFAAVGTAIQAKLSEAISTAMAAGTEGGAPAGAGDAGAGQGASIVSGLVTSITAQVEGADFSAVGAAIMTAIGSGLGAATGELQAAAAAVIDAVVASATQAATQAQEIGRAIVEAAGSGMGAATGEMQSAMQAVIGATITSATGEASSQSPPIGAALVTGAASGVGGATGEFQSAVTAMISAVVASGVADATSQSPQIGTAVATSAGTGIGAATGEFQSAITAMVDAGIAAGVAAAAAASDIGAAISSGAASGVILNALDGAVATMVSNGIAAGMAAAGAASPSKVMMQLGRWLSEGAAIGVDEQAGLVSARVREMIESAIGSAREAAGKFASGTDGLFADAAAEPTLNIGAQLAQGFWQGMLSEVPQTIEAARFLMRMAVKEADGMAGKLMAKSQGHGMLAEFYRAQFEDMDPWSDPAKYVSLQKKMLDAQAKQQSFHVSGINQQRYDVGQELNQAVRRGDDKDVIQALRLERRLLGELADAQHRAYSAPEGSGAEEIAGLRVQFLTQKLEDLGELDIGAKVGEDISTGMETATDATETATDSMKRGLNSVGGVAEQAAEKLGYSFTEAGGVAQGAIQDALSKIGDKLGTSRDMGETAGADLTTGIGSGMRSGMPDVQTMLDDIMARAGMTATQDGREAGTGFTSGLRSTLPNAADLADRIMSDIQHGFEGIGKIGTSSGKELGSGFASGLNASNAPAVADRLVNLTTRNIITGGNDAAQAANDAGLNIGNRLSTGISRSGGDALRTASNVNTRINNSLSGTFSKVDLGSVNTGGVSNSVTSTLNSIGRISGLNQGRQIGASLGQGIIEGQRGKASTIREAVLNSINSASGINSSTGGNAVGKSFGQGMADGAATTGSIINTAVKKLVDKAYQAGMDAANAKSPSKRFAELGGFFAQGMAIGIDHDAAAVTRSMRDLIDDTAAEARKFDGSLGPVGFTGENGGGAGSGRQAPAPVVIHQTFEIRDARFESTDDFEAFFTARAHESAISASR